MPAGVELNGETVDFRGCVYALVRYTLFSVHPALDTIVLAAGTRQPISGGLSKTEFGGNFGGPDDPGQTRTLLPVFDQQDHDIKPLIYILKMQS